jgi:hypothetical protein
LGWANLQRPVHKAHGTEHRLENDISQKFWRYNHYALPATKCERTFSNAKKLVTSERNRLSDEVIKATDVVGRRRY